VLTILRIRSGADKESADLRQFVVVHFAAVEEMGE
jgi:hypothetical protein